MDRAEKKTGTSKTLRITLFIPTLAGGGAERVMLTLAKYFAKRGYMTDLLLLRAEGELLNQFESNINIVVFDKQKPRQAIFPLTRWLGKNRPQVLISSLAQLNWVACLSVTAARTGTRCICREESTFSKTISSLNLLDRHLRPLLLRLFCQHAHFVAVSQGAARNLTTTLGLNPSIVTTISNPVLDKSIFKKAKRTVDHPWFRYGHPPIILAVGRLHKAKGFDILLKSFAEVKVKNTARLIILGDGPERSSLEKQIQYLNLESSVSMPGFVKNPIAYMARSDIFVLSSRWEGLGNVLIEAMSCGVPLVSTDCPSGPREILDNGRYGDLVPVEDHRALAQSMLKALDNTRPQPVPKYWLDQFQVETVVTKHLELIYMILNNPSAPTPPAPSCPLKQLSQ